MTFSGSSWLTMAAPMARLAQPESKVPELSRSLGEATAMPAWRASRTCPLEQRSWSSWTETTATIPLN